MPSTFNDQKTTASGTEPELLFLGLVNALRDEGFVVDATVIADFIALFVAFPDLKELKFLLSPIISRNEAEQQSFYELYDEWLKSQLIYDILPPLPKLPNTNVLHKRYIILIASISTFFLITATIFAIIRGHRDHVFIPVAIVVDSSIKTGPHTLNPSKNKPIVPGGHPTSSKYPTPLNGCPIRVTVQPIFATDFEDSINVDQRVKLLPVFILAAAITLAIFLTAYLLAISKRKKLLQQKEVVLNPESYHSPAIIPFTAKESFIYEERLLVSTCRRLKNKVENEIYALDIKSTIDKTVNNFGLFTAAYHQKKQDREYLILIDADGPYHLSLHLFSYLANIFIRENIKLTYYYFYRNTEKLYLPKSAAPLTWDHLNQLFSQSILVVVSDGYRFLHDTNPAISKKMEIELRKWEIRVLVTPVPLNDWNSKETILNKTFKIIPADLQGWLRLLPETSGEKPASIVQREFNTYGCKRFDFEKIEQLKAYLNDEDIFQWVCALAVYHQTRWELIVEIGRKVLGSKKVLYKLNYSNLLKISRISWMNEGVFPASTRLDLLKSLTIENETLARKVMLNMFAYSDKLLKENSPAYQEKAVEVYTNKFILYVSNPVEFRHFEEDEDVFLSFWQKGRLADTSLQIYLKNEKQEWATPITSPAGNIAAVKIENYIIQRNKINGLYLNMERGLQILICFLINFLLIHIIAYNLASDLVLNGMNKRLALLETVSPRQNVKVSFEAGNVFEQMLDKNGPHNFKVIYRGADTTETITYNPNEILKQPYTDWNGNVVKGGRYSYDFNFHNINFYNGYYKTGKIEIDILNQTFINQIPLNCNQYLILFNQPDCTVKKVHPR